MERFGKNCLRHWNLSKELLEKVYYKNVRKQKNYGYYRKRQNMKNALYLLN